MTAPGNAPMLITLLAAFVACAGYAAGRLHQWYRTGLDRDEAYREGYDTATRSTFSLAARIIGPRRDRAAIRASASVHAAGARSHTAPVPSPSAPDGASPGETSTDEVAGPKRHRKGRHFVPDELVRAVTHRLAPDRLARAKVPEAKPPTDEVAEEETSPRRSVPKPRAS